MFRQSRRKRSGIVNPLPTHRRALAPEVYAKRWQVSIRFGGSRTLRQEDRWLLLEAMRPCVFRARQSTTGRSAGDRIEASRPGQGESLRLRRVTAALPPAPAQDSGAPQQEPRRIRKSAPDRRGIAASPVHALWPTLCRCPFPSRDGRSASQTGQVSPGASVAQTCLARTTGSMNGGLPHLQVRVPTGVLCQVTNRGALPCS